MDKNNVHSTNNALDFKGAFTMTAQFQEEHYQVNGTQVVALTAGQGPEVVFLHGAGTFPGFAPILPWAENHKVIIPYHVHFGKSGSSDTIQTIDDHVLHYMDLFDQMRLENFSLAGFSMGGWIAAEFAIRQPKRVNNLTLVAPAGLAIAEVNQPNLLELQPEEIPSYLTHDPAVALSYFPQEPDPNFDAQLGREMQGLAATLAANPKGNPRLKNWLHRARMPTLLVWGENDRLLPITLAEHWQHYLPNAQLRRLPKTGHLVLEENPDASRLIKEFL